MAKVESDLSQKRQVFSTEKSEYHFNTLNLKNRKRESRWRSLASFALPVIILFLAFGIQGVFPFGNRHILTVDLYHQYAPFLVELREKILAGESLFFSWSAGLGINFFSLFAYYLASPLNILSLFFPLQYLSELVLVLVLLKIGLAGFSFHYFLKKYYCRDGPLALGFSVAYALSGYVMAFFFNIMWLDTLYLLPLLALTMTKLIRNGPMTPYIFILALTLTSNFYSGFFACFFMLFFFSIIAEREEGDLREVLATLCKVGAATLIGIGISFIILFPTYKAMMLSSAAGDSFPSKFELSFPTIDFLSRFIPLSSVSIRRGMANVFSGTFVFILLFAYYKSYSIRLRRKVLHFALLLFLIFSLNNNVLNFIWHGFHYPNQLPYRNSYVLVFFLLFMVYDSLPRLKEIKRSDWTSFFILFAILLLVLQKVDGETYTNISIFSGIFFLGLYAALFSTYLPQRRLPQTLPLHPRRRQRQRANAAFLLLAVILCEFSLNTFVSIDRVEADEYFGLREGYSSGVDVLHLRSVIEDLQKADEANLVRMEIRPDKCVNDAMLYRTKGFTIFSSTFPKTPVKAIANFGYPNNGINSFQYCGSTPIMNSIFGIDYLISKEKAHITDRTLELAYANDQLYVYKNPYALPLVFMSSQNILNNAFSLEDIYDTTNQQVTGVPLNPFVCQEEFYRKLSDYYSDKAIFVEQELMENPLARKDTLVECKEGEYSLERNSNYNGSVEFSLAIEEEGNYYLAWQLSGLNMSEVRLKDGQDWVQSIGKKGTSISELGYHEKGKILTIEVDLKGEKNKNKSGTLKLAAVRLDENEFRQAYQRLNEFSGEISWQSDRSFQVRTSNESESVLFVSTIADPGWKVRVDGEDKELFVVNNAFLALPLTAGQHQIEFSYTPDGFKEGFLVAIISLALCLFLLVFDIFSAKEKKRLLAEQKAGLASKNDRVFYDSVLRGWPEPLPEDKETDDGATSDEANE